MKTKTLQDFAQDESPKKLRKQKKNKNSEPENKNSKRSTFHRFLPFLSRDKKELIYPVQEFQEDGTVICEYNGEKQIQALFRPTPYDLSKLTDEEFERISNGYWEFHRLYKKQMKEFYINFPENNKDNQSFINEKMKQENDAVKLRFLDYEMQKLKIQEKWVKTRQSFIAVYGKDQEELETRITELQTAGKRLFTFKQLDKKEVLLLFELINNSGKLSEAHRLLKKRQDNEDIVQTAPRGGLIFGANYKYFESGADYRTVLYVSDLPQTKKDFWISGIVNREYVDAATVDYVMNESVNYEKEIAETVENYEDEAAQAKKTVVRDAALKNANELRRLADKMNDIGEIIKKFAQDLNLLGSLPEVIAFIDQEVQKEADKVAQKITPVSKRRYRFFKYFGVLAIVAALVLGGLTYSYVSNNKKQAAIITAQTSFLTNNYAQTQTDLEKYSLKSLPKSARYVLAVSSVNLSDLTLTQKEAILNTVSTKSDDNTLNYWGYTGRGDFDQALNLAKNLGDTQLTLLAYTNLYEVTKLNSTMDGEKKQKLMEEYDKQIQELTKSLGK
ncbi:hypothetical protein OfM1_05500 [Lactovum odontotermitis]